MPCALVRARVVPAALELIDGECLAAVASHLGTGALAPAGTAAVLLIELDGEAAAIAAESDRVGRRAACRRHRATTARGRRTLGARRIVARAAGVSPALKQIATFKLNNDVVVPRARIPQLFEAIAELRARYRLPIPAFGHAGDGNIHVNIMVPDPATRARCAHARGGAGAVRGGSPARGPICGEHGIGLTKKHYLPMELGAGRIALMQRLKQAFDPNGILNPGKIFP